MAQRLSCKLFQAARLGTLFLSLKQQTSILLALSLAGCATLPENVNQIDSYAYTDTEETRLGQDFQDERSTHPDESGFFLLGNGLDAFVARAALAQAAERSIDAQYYLLHDDLTGRLFIDQLLKAADRGVRGGQPGHRASLDSHSDSLPKDFL